MNTKEEKLKVINSIAKETDIHLLLEELLPLIGFNDVTVTHERGNAPENGKDLICSILDPIENRKDWYAFVVKKGVIGGTSTAIREIEAQVSDCFEYEYKSVTKGERIKINKVKVVTNRHFSSGATQKILDKNIFDKANITFWDDNRLYDLIENNHPQYWLNGSRVYKQYIERLETRIGEDDLVKSLNLNSSKISKIIDCAIKPRLSEKIKNADGSFSRKVRDVNSIIDISDNAIIVGEPGCGKSTLFKKLTKDIILQNGLRKCDFYPVLISFRDLLRNDFNLLDTIKDYFSQDWNKDLSINANEIISQNRISIFIDALDELATVEYKEKAVEAVKSFNEIYPDIKIVCSSRPSDFLVEREDGLGFKILDIADLNPAQIKEFVSSFFSDNIIKSERLLKSLKDSGLLEKLPKTPLTIALITIIFDEKEVEIPATISDLYRHFVDLLLGRADIKQNTDLIEIGIKHRLLCYIAKEFHTSNIYSLDKLKVIELIEKYAVSRGNTFDCNTMLNDLIFHSGLIYENEKTEIQFKHLSFQEYFTAYEYFHHRQSESDILINNFNILWWQNVTIFYAGISKDAPEFLTNIVNKAQPKDFFQVINNIGGLGKLTQALYNTPKEQRKLAVSRSIENSVYSIYELISSTDPKLAFWKKFSKYGIYQIMSGWFHHNFHSITLVEIFKEYAYEKLKLIDPESPKYIKELKEEEIFEIEMSLFMATGLLTSNQFQYFEEFKKLVDFRRSKDLSFIALIEIHFRRAYKSLSREKQLDPSVDKVHKKLFQLIKSLGNITGTVNKTIEELTDQKDENQ